MKLRILLPAETEISDAIKYYNELSLGLGYEFANEIKTSLNIIAKYPNAWPVYFDSIRKCMVRRFPFAIIYEVKNNLILILGVMNFKMNPKRWKVRIINNKS